MPQTARPRLAELTLFGRNFLRHPKLLGSAIPSSRFLVHRLMRQVPWERARVIVEFGPGVGTITRHLLRRLHPEARLLAFEMNTDFVRFLQRTIPDPRFTVINASAAEVGRTLQRLRLVHADCIISGIPYSTMTPDDRQEILHASYDALTPGGLMLIYQFTRAVRPGIREVFGEVREGFEPLNILPAYIFAANRNGHKPGAAHSSKAGNGA